MELRQNQQRVEEIHEYDSLTNMDLPQRTKPLKNDKIEYEAFQRKMIVSLVALSIALCAVIATLTVIMYNLHDRDIKEKESQWNETSRKTSKHLKDLHQNVTIFQQELIQQQSKANKTMFEYIQQTRQNRVAVKMCVQSTKSYSSNTIIPFKDIKTMNGINDTGRSNIQTTGKFTCETPGLYVISVFITTETHRLYVLVYKNSDNIGYIYFSLNGWIQTNSVTVVENLTVNDSIYVKTPTDIYVYKGVDSCMSVIQVN